MMSKRSHNQDRLTYRVEWVKDIPSTGVAVEVWAVALDGSKMRIRSSDIEHMKKLRAINHVPTHITDLSFLAQGLDGMLTEMGFDHCELAIAPMSPKKDKSRVIEFPPDAFEQGTTHAENL